MRKIVAFTMVSVDGFFAGPNGEIDWFKTEDDEDREFSAKQSESSSLLIFGRTTYELMAGFWATPEAIQSNPSVAEVMNKTPKIVFSKTLQPVKEGPLWKNVTISREINPYEILQLKKEGEGNIAILGSGTVVRQFACLGLIDEYGLMVIPVILGTGKYLFRDVNRINLECLGIETFRNGRVLLRYRPVLKEGAEEEKAED
jgi:dihydrofolate reductase